jgi:alkanesulfonate monooxygenase SsuD/methylene tetrahydromethanopterin reductase-like flavin-dependent oxidoreductase (luciferase family)
MRFALYLNPQTRGPEDDAAVIDLVTRMSVEADRLGFTAVMLTEHHFTGYNTFSDPFVFGAYLAPQLKQARIGSSIAVAPLYDPLRFAEHCNLLDQLSHGRAVIGVGPGGSPIEFAGFGRDHRSARALTEEVLEIALQAWAHEYGDPPLEFETAFARGRLDGRIMPTSVRKPHPLLARACVSDASVIKSAERGWPIFTGRFSPERTGHQWQLYQDKLVSAGHSPTLVEECREWSAALKMIYVAETDAQAWADLDEPITNYLQAAWIANSADSLEAEISRDANGRIVFATSVPAESRQALVERAMIAGSPETVAARLLEYAAVGMDHLMLWFVWGYNSPERVWRSFELFNQEVRPRLVGAVRQSRAPLSS